MNETKPHFHALSLHTKSVLHLSPRASSVQSQSNKTTADTPDNRVAPTAEG